MGDVRGDVAPEVRSGALAPEVRSDEALARAAAAGDDSAFLNLYHRYLPVARRSARRAVRSHPQLDVDETANLALARLWQVMGRFDTSREFAPWAAVVIAHAVRSAAGMTRSLKSTMNWSAMLSSTADADEDRLARIAAPSDAVHSGEDAVLLSEEERLVAEVLGDLLSPREAKVVRLRLAGWSYTEIAERLDVDFKAVDNAMRRGIDKLRQTFTDPDEGVVDRGR